MLFITILVLLGLAPTWARVYHFAAILPLSVVDNYYYFGQNGYAELAYIEDRLNSDIMADTNDTIQIHPFDNQGENLAAIFDAGFEITDVCGTTGVDYLAVFGPDYTRNLAIVEYFQAKRLAVYAHELTGDIANADDNFVRITIADSYESMQLAQFAKSQGWLRLGVLAADTSYGASLTKSLQRAVAILGMTIELAQTFAEGENGGPGNATEALLSLKRASIRIIAVFANNMNGIFPQATLLGMTTADYVYLGTDGSLQNAFPLGSFWTNIWYNDSLPAVIEYRRAVTSLPNTTWTGRAVFGEYNVHLYEGLMLPTFEVRKLSHLAAVCQGGPEALWQAVVENTCFRPSPICTQLSTDRAAICSQLGDLASERELMIQLARATPYPGPTGPVVIDPQGNRAMPCALVNQGAEPNYTAGWDVSQQVAVGLVTLDGQVVLNEGLVVYPGRSTVPPLDRPGARVGDLLLLNLDSSLQVLAWTSTLISGWVASVLTENVLFHYRKSQLAATIGWGLATTSALTLAAWAGPLVASASISFPEVPAGTPTDRAPWLYAAWLLPALAFSIVGLILLRYGSAVSTSVAPASRTLASSASQYVLQQQLPRRSLLIGIGAILLGISLDRTNALLLADLHSAAYQSINYGLVPITIIWASLWSAGALVGLYYGRGPLQRVGGVAALTMAVMSDWSIVLKGIAFYYDPAQAILGASTNELVLVSMILTGLAAIILQGLTVIVTKGSRDALQAHFNSEQRKTRQLQADLATCQRALARESETWNIIHSITSTTNLGHPVMAQVVAEVQRGRPGYIIQYFGPGWKVRHGLCVDDQFFRCDVAVEVLKTHLGAGLRASADNVAFLAEVNRYRRLPRSARPAMAKQIVETFLQADEGLGFGESKRQTINTGSIQTQLVARAAADEYKVGVKFFDGAAREVYKLINTNDFKGSLAEICAYLLEWTAMRRSEAPGLPSPVQSAADSDLEGETAGLGSIAVVSTS